VFCMVVVTLRWLPSLRMVVKGLFGSLKAVKDGTGLELWASCRRCLLFSDQRLDHWFLSVYIGGDTEGGCFVQSSGWGFSIFCGSGLGRSCFSCQTSWVAGFGVRAAWVGYAFGGVV
jgi:hypothetical protein